MQKIQISNSQAFIDYIPAQLSEGKVWYIYYHVKEPGSGKLKRIRMKMNRIKSLTERRKHCKRIISAINIKLSEGWNPLLENSAPKGFSKFNKVLDDYLNYAKNNFRESTLKSYKSILNKFYKYLDSKGKLDSYIVDFNSTDAKIYMRWIDIEYNLSARTWNNNKTLMLILFNWMKDGGYINHNPFSEIKKKKEGHKLRHQYIKPVERRRIINYFDNHNKQMSLFIKTMYHCLIRPSELSKIIIEYIDLQEQTIKIPAHISKNGKERFATIPDILIIDFLKLDFSAVKQDYYLFGKDSMKPSTEHIDTRRVGDKWRKMRKDLGYDNSLQIYSLRDTGIIQKLKDGISPDEVMYQADHSSLEVTNKYVRIANPKIYTQIKERASKF